jgi:hypothetical protein
MPRRMKIFLPRWVMWFILPLLILVWGVITFIAFATPAGQDELGLFGWIGLTLVLLLIAVMMLLMSSGKLPAYLIELEDDDNAPPKR